MTPFRSLILIAAAALCAVPAAAQNFPNRPVRVIVPLAPGGGMDSVSRGVSARLGEYFGQTFVVDNRPGAGSQVALDILAGSAPDGHTLMMISATTVVYPMLYKAKYDIVRDYTPVSQATAQGYVFIVHPSIPAKNVAEMIQYMKANPNKLNFSSSGIGSPIHMTGELFKLATGTKMTHIPYKGQGAAYSDLLAGHIQTSFAAIISSIAHIKGGRLRPLAVTPAKRVPALPDVPTMLEAGVKGVVVVNWYGLIAPKQTPKAIVDRIAGETAKAMKSNEMTKSLAAEGSEGVGGTAEQFVAHLKAEQAMWSRVVKEAGIRGE